MASSGERPYRHRLRVRYAECDPQGVVFHGHFFLYFDVAMTEFHRATMGRYSELGEDGVDMVIAEARARYYGPARFDEELEIEVTVKRIGNTSLTNSFAVSNQERILVSGEVRYVFVDIETKKKQPIPIVVREALDRHVKHVQG